jgi:type 1 glutamine amidotransferase
MVFIKSDMEKDMEDILMQKNKRAILIGDNTLADWHPLKGPGKEITEALSEFEIVQSEDYDQFREENLKQYDLCISFIDRWNYRMTDDQTCGLLSYVCHGGGLLIIHNGIALQARYELAQLAGGKFLGHPEEKVLNYKPTSSGHVIMEGIEAFAVKEEPYRFELDNMVETQILMEYEDEGKLWPAAWAHDYGFGRVAYLSPGHNIETYRDPMFRKIIGRSGLWAAGSI